MLQGELQTLVGIDAAVAVEGRPLRIVHRRGAARRAADDVGDVGRCERGTGLQPQRHAARHEGRSHRSALHRAIVVGAIAALQHIGHEGGLGFRIEARCERIEGAAHHAAGRQDGGAHADGAKTGAVGREIAAQPHDIHAVEHHVRAVAARVGVEGVGIVLARSETTHRDGRRNGGRAFAHEVIGGGGEVFGCMPRHSGGGESPLVAFGPEVEGAFALRRTRERDGQHHFGRGVVHIDANLVHAQLDAPVLFEVVAVGTRADVGTAFPESRIVGHELALREDVGAHFEAHGAVGRLPPKGEFGVGIDAVFAFFLAGEAHVARLSGLEGGADVEVVDALVAHGGNDHASRAGEVGKRAIVGRGAVVRADLRAETQVDHPGHSTALGKTADEAHVFYHLGGLEGGGDEHERGAGGDTVETVAHFAAGGDGRHVGAVAAPLEVDLVGAVDDRGAVDRQRTVGAGLVAAAIPEREDAAAPLLVEESGVAVLKTAVDDPDDHAAPVEGRVEQLAALHAVDVGGAARFVEQRGEGAAGRDALHTRVGAQAAELRSVGTQGDKVVAEHRGVRVGIVGGEGFGGRGLDQYVGEGFGRAVVPTAVRASIEIKAVERGVYLVETETIAAMKGGDEGGRGARAGGCGGTADREQTAEQEGGEHGWGFHFAPAAA